MKRIKFSILIVLAILLNVNVFSQSVGINDDGSQPDSRVILDIKSNNKGILLPRLTDAERNALYQNVPNGMLIFNTTANQFQVFINNMWYPLAMGTGISASSCVPASPGTITGSANVATNASGIVYSIVAVSGATNYNWTVPPGASISAGQGTTSITVTFGTTNGNVSVRAENTCGNSAYTDKSVTITPAGITDIDGNVYHSVTIGTQTWMVENLKTTKYNDGTAIPDVTDGTAWSNLTTPAYCWYNNDAANKTTSGALYNWYAVNTGKLAPTGWHVPSEAEWTTLEDYLIANGYNYDCTTNGNSITNNKIAKALASSTNWNFSSETGTPGNTDYPAKRNATGFTTLPDGYLYYYGTFYGIGIGGGWWSSTEYGTYAWYLYFFYNNYNMSSDLNYKGSGLSVRCIKN